MDVIQECLGEYNPLTTVVARKIAKFDLISEMIGEVAFDQTLSTRARISELEVLAALIEHNLTVLGRTEKRRRKK